MRGAGSRGAGEAHLRVLCGRQVRVRPVASGDYRDAPQGRFVLSTDALVNDSGAADLVAPWATQTPEWENLLESTLLYLLGSRYCETDQLTEMAWQRFGSAPTGWGRVQAICDFVHNHIQFGYQNTGSRRRCSRQRQLTWQYA